MSKTRSSAFENARGHLCVFMIVCSAMAVVVPELVGPGPTQISPPIIDDRLMLIVVDKETPLDALARPGLRSQRRVEERGMRWRERIGAVVSLE